MGNDMELYTLKSHPTEAIVLTFCAGQHTVSEINEAMQKIKHAFPENVVIALPDGRYGLHSYSKDVLENYISMIAEVIDQL